MRGEQLRTDQRRRSLGRTYLMGAGLVILTMLTVLVGPSRPVQAAPDAEEWTFLAIINVYREHNGLGPLMISPRLIASAEWMSQDLASKSYFAHNDSLGRNPFQRIDAFGYSYNAWKGENLAAGNAGAQAAFDQWRYSPGHNANMLNPNYEVIGVARAQGGAYGWYWATNFGGYDDR